MKDVGRLSLPVASRLSWIRANELSGAKQNPYRDLSQIADGLLVASVKIVFEADLIINMIVAKYF